MKHIKTAILKILIFIKNIILLFNLILPLYHATYSCIIEQTYILIYEDIVLLLRVQLEYIFQALNKIIS